MQRCVLGLAVGIVLLLLLLLLKHLVFATTYTTITTITTATTTTTTSGDEINPPLLSTGVNLESMEEVFFHFIRLPWYERLRIHPKVVVVKGSSGGGSSSITATGNKILIHSTTTDNVEKGDGGEERKIG